MLEESSPGCHGTDGPHDNKELIAFLSEGVRVEGSAQRRGEGVWRGSVHEARWRKVARFLRLKTSLFSISQSSDFSPLANQLTVYAMTNLHKVSSNNVCPLYIQCDCIFV